MTARTESMSWDDAVLRLGKCAEEITALARTPQDDAFDHLVKSVRDAAEHFREHAAPLPNREAARQLDSLRDVANGIADLMVCVRAAHGTDYIEGF